MTSPLSRDIKPISGLINHHVIYLKNYITIYLRTLSLGNDKKLILLFKQKKKMQFLYIRHINNRLQN